MRDCSLTLILLAPTMLMHIIVKNFGETNILAKISCHQNIFAKKLYFRGHAKMKIFVPTLRRTRLVRLGFLFVSLFVILNLFWTLFKSENNLKSKSDETAQQNEKCIL